MSVEERVWDLLDGVVNSLGVELLDIEYAGGSLRVTVDAEGGVTTEQLAEVNRLISPLLDQHDPIPGRYLLEVSSPGLERRLRSAAHFRRAVGEQVIVKLLPGPDRRRFRGLLVDASDDDATIEAVEIDGVDLDESESHTVDLASVDRARTVFEWGPAPKPGQGGKQKKSGGRPSGSKAGGNKAGKKKQSPQARGV